MTDFVAATERLQEQLGAYPNVLNPEFFKNPVSHRDAIATITALVAGQFVPCADNGDLPTPKAIVEYLDGWRESLRGACSDEFKALEMGQRGDASGLDRTDLNRQPEMVVLNGLRLGVGQAMRNARQRADAGRYGQRWQHTPATI